MLIKCVWYAIVFVQLWLKASVFVENERERSPCVANKLTYFSNLMHFKRNGYKRIRICEWWMVKCVMFITVFTNEKNMSEKRLIAIITYRLYEWNYVNVNPWSKRITNWRIFIYLFIYFFGDIPFGFRDFSLVIKRNY